MRHTFFSQPMRPSSSKESSFGEAEAATAACLDLATTSSTESRAASTLEATPRRTESLVDSSMNLKVTFTALYSYNEKKLVFVII